MGDPEMGEAPQNNKIFQKKKIMREILLLLVKSFLSKEVNKLSFGDHIDIDGKDYLEAPLKGTGLDLYFNSIRFTCEITHENGDVKGKRTDPKYFKLRFHYSTCGYTENSVLYRYVKKGNEIFEESLGRWYKSFEDFPEFPKQFLYEWGGSYSNFSKRYDTEPCDGIYTGGSSMNKYHSWFWDETKKERFLVKTFIGKTRYDVLSKFLEFWNEYMEMLEFLCIHGFKAARLGKVLVEKYPSIVFFGHKAVNSYIYTMYNKFKNKEHDLATWKVHNFNEYTGQFEWTPLDKSILHRIYELITKYFGYPTWDDLYLRNKLLTDEDIQVISELDETSFKGSYPAKTFKDFMFSLDCEALPCGRKELPWKMDGLEFIQYAEEVH